ncbi:unnamed protein product [Rotaria socialis]|uniref:Kinesin-associated protein 3 n=2 Tax=Rotaria socialis TaxID=392032 RepID=A0A819WPW7_9BILA|nr:unnamed protein product [Rotaria socialis]CAF3335466.1 unnamed protein product [Rotaria socialis]CAF3396077.1 unnamed protein product [Rotaria socialis]CAF3400240.1 unnamed protein product [Rotaria socialis]CAF3459287.1 unnamed protein product [Rotaria socialis]
MKVARLIPSHQADLLNITLRLLLNLSFDRDIRAQIVRIGLLPKLVDLIDDENQRLICLCLLYHLSMDDRTKGYFTYTKCNQNLMKLIIDCKEERTEPEVIALAINLALNPGCAEQLLEYKHGKGLKLLMKKAYKYKDSLIMKMIKNISSHASPDIKSQFVPYVGPLGETLITEKDEVFLTEAVGTLANLTMPDIDYQALMDEYGLVEWIKSKLKPNSADTELTLNVVVLVGTLCADDACAEVLAKSDIIQILIDLLHAQQEDDEIVLQICYVFYQLCFHKSTRNVIIKNTEAPAYLIDLMQDKNKEVRRVCDMTLEIISECDNDWAGRIKHARFRNHNQTWLETIEGQQISYEDDEPSPTGNAEPYGFDPMSFGDQDDYQDQFGYNEGDGYPLDGRESPDMNHWNSINSGGDMDIDREPYTYMRDDYMGMDIDAANFTQAQRTAR